MNNILACFIIVLACSCGHSNSERDSTAEERQDSMYNEPFNGTNLRVSNMADNVIKTQNIPLKDSLPDTVLAYVDNNLSDYKFIPIQDYADDWKVFYNDLPHLPYFIKGDFNGDKLLDYALLLYFSGNEICLLVLHGQDGGSFNNILVENFGGSSISKKLYLGLLLKEKGLIQDGFGHSVNLTNTAIVLYRFEKSNSIYYFDNGSYKKF